MGDRATKVMRVGGCACGLIRLELANEPTLVRLCHCASCRRAVGAGPVAWATFPRADVRVVGPLHWYSSSLRAERGHCAECGTSLLLRAPRSPDEVDVCVDALGPEQPLSPTCHVWVCERAPFVRLDDGLARHVGDSRSPQRDPTLSLRAETELDLAAIRRVQTEAFGQPDEALMVDRLRAAGALTLSLLAEHGHEVVGHVALSPVRVEGSSAQLSVALGLAPVAVLPHRQRRGIGSQLICEALARARVAGYPSVFVLGAVEYYSRFGFECAEAHHLRWEHPAPREAFMVQALQPQGIPPFAGFVRFRPELS